MTFISFFPILQLHQKVLDFNFQLAMFSFYFNLLILLVTSVRTLADGEGMQQNSEILDFESSSQSDISEMYNLRTAEVFKQQSIPIINLEVNTARTVII